MFKKRQSRRDFLNASALGTAGIAGITAALADPPQAAAQAVGVKKADLPDLTIKEVKVYVTDLGEVRRLNGTETGEIISIVTNNGIEGNYTIGNRNLTAGWLEWAKPVLMGKNVVDLLPTITATSGLKAGYGFGSGARDGFGGGGGRGGAGGGRGGVRERGAVGPVVPRRVAAPADVVQAADLTAAPGRAVAGTGRTTTQRQRKSPCGTSSARPSIAPFTNSSAEPKTA
jgi:hypothetical protein